MTCARDLRPVPLDEAMAAISTGAVVVTMAEGQWDALLARAYALGWVLLELGPDDRPRRAYRKVGRTAADAP